MKTIAIFVALLISSMCNAQEKEFIQFSLIKNEVVVIGDKEVKFKHVLSDSRCPIGAQCIWAGEAKVLIEIADKNGNFLEKEITISNVQNQLAGLLDQPGIHLENSFLKPYPSVKGKINPEDYLLTIGFSVEN